jgi:hypothetical protein
MLLLVPIAKVNVRAPNVFIMLAISERPTRATALDAPATRYVRGRMLKAGERASRVRCICVRNDASLDGVSEVERHLPLGHPIDLVTSALSAGNSAACDTPDAADVQRLCPRLAVDDRILQPCCTGLFRRLRRSAAASASRLLPSAQ